MGRLLCIFTTMALGFAVAGCGGSGATTSTKTSPVIRLNFSTHHNDRDNDGDHNDDDGKVFYYGHAADTADQIASEALVTRYLAAAAAEDGAKACGMLAPFMAESVAETDGHSPGLRGKTCAVVMSKLFKLHHALLAKKNASLKVIGVRVEGTRGLVILEFPAIPEVRQLIERRMGSGWKLIDLLDGILE